VTVDNAKVVKTDVAAKNGVIHVIDTCAPQVTGARRGRRANTIPTSPNTDKVNTMKAPSDSDNP